MWELLVAYWPHILAALSVTMATAAIVHVVMTKDDVRAATGCTACEKVVGFLHVASGSPTRRQRAKSALGRYPPSKTLVDLIIKIFSYSSQSIDTLLRHQFDRGSSSKQRRTVWAHDPTVGLELIGKDRVQRFIDAKNVADAN